MNTTDIATIEDIKRLVNQFYARVQKDELLGPIFNSVLHNRWPEHLEIMYRFWETVLLDKHTYHGSPFLAHVKLPVDAKHFDRWLELFNQTVNENFEGVNAAKAKLQGRRMAEIFYHKLSYGA
jgi:hemoglobin